MINILIRTGAREKTFKRLIRSIMDQTISKDQVRLFISKDTDNDFVYDALTCGLQVNIQNVTKTHIPFGYNLYLNRLLELVADGWVLIIDDDDYLIDDEALERLHNRLVNENTLYLFKIKLGGKHDIPSDTIIKKDILKKGQVSMSGFSFHVKQRPYITFRAVQGADYYACLDLYETLYHVWLPITVVETGNFGLRGIDNL